MVITKQMVKDRILYYLNNNSYRVLQEAKILEVTEGGNVKLKNQQSIQWYTPKELESMSLVEVITGSDSEMEYILGRSLAEKPHEPIEFDRKKFGKYLLEKVMKK